jgi:aspartokinase/homoserine dehydrogenase 1
MKVLKFGGSSVANAENIQKVVSIVTGNTEPQIVVVSALGGVTDALINAGTLAEQTDETYKDVLKELENKHLDTARALLPVTHQSSCLSMIKQQFNTLEEICNSVFYLKELSLRTKDRIISFGELLSSKIITAFLQSKHVDADWLDSRQFIKTNSNFGFATVDFQATNTLITAAIQSNKKIYMAPGFIASDANNNTTTLGRGGSDYTAAIYAAAVNASSLEIWTDVSGMMTADPRWVSNAKPIDRISYQEAMELSHFGAKVVYPPTIQPVRQKNIPTWVKNTFAPSDPGTVIDSIATHEGDIVTGISSINAVALLSLEGSGMIGIPGFSKRLFEALANANINVILITQSSSEHSICVAVNISDATKPRRQLIMLLKLKLHRIKLSRLKWKQSSLLLPW